jgi:tRNA A-37 threonylcarbamoyl transferase component Bud32
LFQSEEYQQIFFKNQLAEFAQIWAKNIDWFEEPNHRRGGWSGVGQLILPANNGELNVFVKKQQNHGRRTVLHPISGEPTFRREFKRLGFLEKHHIGAPKVVFYEEKKINGNACAILVTKTLINYEPLDVVTKRWFLQENISRQQKKELLKKLAEVLRGFHQSGLVHRALYPKHIFVKNSESQPEVALIDLEKARFSLSFLYRAYFDLSALNRHAEFWSRSQKLYFFLQYFQIKRLNRFLKVMCQLIVKRSMR